MSKNENKPVVEETFENQEVEVTQDELVSLKARADALGLRYHPSIGVDSLRDKVNAAIRNDLSERVDNPGIHPKGEVDDPVDPSILPANNPTPLVTGDNGSQKIQNKLDKAEENAGKTKEEIEVLTEAQKLVQERIKLRKQANALVRIRVTCMNPAKVEWDGEVFTTGNMAVGTLSKFVPFNNDEGWHVPQMILQMIQDRQCQIFTSVRDARGNVSRKGKLIKEFAVEIMDPLTPEELKDLAQRQALGGGV